MYWSSQTNECPRSPAQGGSLSGRASPLQSPVRPLRHGRTCWTVRAFINLSLAFGSKDERLAEAQLMASTSTNASSNQRLYNLATQNLACRPAALRWAGRLLEISGPTPDQPNQNWYLERDPQVFFCTLKFWDALVFISSRIRRMRANRTLLSSGGWWRIWHNSSPFPNVQRTWWFGITSE